MSTQGKSERRYFELSQDDIQTKEQGEMMQSYSCGVEKKCGACQLSNMDYPRQLSYKQAKVVKLLKRYGRVSDIIGMSEPYHYRCKSQYAVRRSRNGSIVTGVYQSSTGAAAAADSCYLNDKTANEIVKFIRSQLIKLRITPFDERSGRGILRHIMIRCGKTTGEYMVVLVCFEDSLKNEEQLVKAVCRQFPCIRSIVLNISRSAKMTLGRTARVLFGEPVISDILCGCRFEISPNSFYQVNPLQTEVLYKTAIDFAGLTGKERILDAYCGIGTIGICAAANAAQVVGVEKNESAVNDALKNAKLNGLTNAIYTEADAGVFMLEAAKNNERFDVVFVDPPRAGCSKAFLTSLSKLSPEKIVYISCAPDTLARDLYFLTGSGYRVRRIQPVDMFPHTSHVETVVQLTQKRLTTQ